jgi:type I restriction enzyme R subunit
MAYNEEETKLYLINPLLKDWISRRWVQMEYEFTKGKITINGSKIERGDRKKADYLLKYGNIQLAIVEAKDESQEPGAGLQQSKGYAETLDLKIAYSTNGHGIEEFDFFTNQQKTVDRFPTPNELWQRIQNSHRLSSETQRLLSVPYFTTESKIPRYYQEIAIRRTIERIASGDRKVLLNLATGTGKTFIAFQIVWKLKQAKKTKRILFLADRNVLCEQAYNTFEPFGNSRDYITEGNIPTAREIYFSIYQAMYAEKDGKRVYLHYPEDFFDLIIIDECHRSGFGSWNDILAHFNTAVQLGMTATPKESENINTYKYFGNPDDDFKPVYEYSMNTGIEDGFLANFILHRFKLNTDANNLNIEEVVEEGAKLEVPEGAEVKEEYSAREFEEKLILPDRTEAMCNKLAEILRKTGEMEKSIVFCVTQDHARQATKLMQNHFANLGYSNYAVTIVSDENEAESLVKVFQDEQTDRPVVASTVDLLSTGFDAPSVRNIVFMKYVSSSIVFKQILGRGSRISEDREKYYFRLIDFTNATRLLSEWETGGQGSGITGNRSGNNMLCGFVYDKETGNPIFGSRIVFQLSPNQQKIELTNDEGYFVCHGLPEGEVYLHASANKFHNKQMKITTSIDTVDPLLIELLKQGTPPKPIKVTGLNVVFDEETVFEVEVTGQRLTLKQYIEYTKEKVVEKFQYAEKLRMEWADREKRKQVIADLEKQGINTEILATATQQPEADELDLLANIAFDKEIHTRQERADALKNLQQQFINSFNEEQKNILYKLLLFYQFNGVDEFYKPAVFNSILGTNGISKAEQKFGSMENLLGAMTQLQQRLYIG